MIFAKKMYAVVVHKIYAKWESVNGKKRFHSWEKIKTTTTHFMTVDEEVQPFQL